MSTVGDVPLSSFLVGLTSCHDGVVTIAIEIPFLQCNLSVIIFILDVRRSQVVDVFGQYSDSPKAEIAEKTDIIKTQQAAVINAAAVMEAVTPIRMP